MGHSEDGNTPKFADTTLSTPQIVDNPNPDFRAITQGLPLSWTHRTFPVTPSTKKPAVKRWNHHRRTARGRDEEQEAYQLRFPGFAVGIRLGLDPVELENLAVLDVDHAEQLTEHQTGVLEAWPWVVATGRGYHCYGLLEGGNRPSRKGLRWGDFLSRAAFSMAPGNQHPEGGLYLPLTGFGQGRCPSFPDSLLEDLIPRETRGKDAPKAPLSSNSPPITPGEGDIGKVRTPPDHKGEGDIGEVRTPPRLLTRLEQSLSTVTAGYRNDAVFTVLRHWAYRQEQPQDLQDWTWSVKLQALRYGELLTDRTDFLNEELLRIAVSVALWTWGKSFRRPAPDPQLQAYRSMLGRVSVRVANRERDAFILELRRQGQSLRAIGREVGITEGAVRKVVARGGQVNPTPEEMANAVRPRGKA